jgi:hypothetical protein
MPSLSIQICLAVPSLKNARQFVNSERSSMKIARVLVRFNHVAGLIVNANHRIMCERLKKLCVADYIADRVRLAIPQATSEIRSTPRSSLRERIS